MERLCNHKLEFNGNHERMAGPLKMKSQQPPRRPKNQRQAPTGTGEEFGLVPAKYLKRKTAEDAASATPQKSNPSEPYTPTTPPRKPPPSPDPLSFLTSPSATASTPSKDSLMRDTIAPVVWNTPQERLVLQEELNRSLTQRGFMKFAASSTFVEDWKASVLRAEGWQVAKATTRVLQHWRLKSELFGIPDLKVTIGDVAPNLVQSGMIQLVPTRDLAGRAIVCLKFSSPVYASQEREVKKYLFYMLASALEDEETQDKGLVLCVWNTQDSSTANPFLATASSAMSSLFDSFWNLWKSIKPAFLISRLHYMTVDMSGTIPYSFKEYEEADSLIRHHTGSAQECLHALLTYGMPLPALPVTPTLNMHTTLHEKWVEWRQRTDSYHHQRHYKIVLVPNRQDVLFGKHSVVNAGNVRFHQMLLGNVEEYHDSSPTEQTAIRTQLYKSLTCDGAKCLQPLDNRMGILWEPMEEAAALGKIADAFDFLASQLLLQDSAKPGQTPEIDPHAVWREWYGMKSCCFVITCKEGYHICGDSSQLSKDWHGR